MTLTPAVAVGCRTLSQLIQGDSAGYLAKQGKVLLENFLSYSYPTMLNTVGECYLFSECRQKSAFVKMFQKWFSCFVFFLLFCFLQLRCWWRQQRKSFFVCELDSHTPTTAGGNRESTTPTSISPYSYLGTIIKIFFPPTKEQLSPRNVQLPSCIRYA